MTSGNSTSSADGPYPKPPPWLAIIPQPTSPVPPTFHSVVMTSGNSTSSADGPYPKPPPGHCPSSPPIGHPSGFPPATPHGLKIGADPGDLHGLVLVQS